MRDKVRIDPVKALGQANRKDHRLMRAATYASAATATVLIALKLIAWLTTDSVAILSSLVDSLLDLVASLVTLFAVRHALVPADAEHRFGHGKAEPLAALTQVGFIAASAVLLVLEAVERLVTPQSIQQTEIGMSVMAVSIAMTLALVMFQRFVIARSASLAIEADSVHYKADLLANLGVLGALIMAGPLGIGWVDPVFAILVAGYIAHSAWGIGVESLNMLMDRELPEDDRERIKEIALGYPDVLDVHDLRTRKSGRDIYIQLHLDFNGILSLNRIHSVTDAVENEIMEAFPGAEVIAHQDPVAEDFAEGIPVEDSETGSEKDKG